MKATKWWWNCFHIIVYAYILSWVITLIVPATWYDIMIIINDLILKLGYIALGISLLNLVETYITREKRYKYIIAVKYTPKKGKDSIVITYINKHKAIYTSHRHVLSEMKIHNSLYPKYKSMLDNGKVEVESVTYLGSEYKY
jgi:hypothetical protein